MTFKTWKELVTLLPDADDNGPKQPLEPWQKALVLELVQVGLLDSPCYALVLITGCSHEEAHQALDILGDKMGIEAADRMLCKDNGSIH
jgi:hypothetical protein